MFIICDVVFQAQSKPFFSSLTIDSQTLVPVLSDFFFWNQLFSDHQNLLHFMPSAQHMKGCIQNYR